MLNERNACHCPFVFKRLRNIGAARLGKKENLFSKRTLFFFLNLMLGLLAKKGEVSYRNTIPDPTAALS